MNRDILIQRVKRKIVEVEPEAKIILYGSRSRVDSTSESDWDFLILLDGTVDDDRIDHLRYHLYDVELETDEIISSIIRNINEWNSLPLNKTPFYKNVINEGITI